jgi:serine/threonine protein kinase
LNDVFIGRYRVIEELGRGGMGIVYRGEDPVLDRPVAIKVLPPKKLVLEQAVKRFLREARLCAKLDHPNIIKIHDIGEEEGIYHIVMEFINGRSLRDIIEERESVVQVDIDYMLKIFLDICEALNYAHQKRVIHRDIKPDNIMITNEGRIKVMDFGLAVIENRHSLTEMGQVMGTVAYFSPEQAKGEAADQRSDIYSLGSLLYEMLTNHLIFHATNPAEMISKHLSETPRTPMEYNRSIPPVIAEMILRALKKLPEERFQSVQEMSGIVRDCLEKRKLGRKDEDAYKVAGNENNPDSRSAKPVSDIAPVSGNTDDTETIEQHYSSFKSNHLPNSIMEESIPRQISSSEINSDVPSGGSFILPVNSPEKSTSSVKTNDETDFAEAEENIKKMVQETITEPAEEPHAIDETGQGTKIFSL